MTQGMPEIKGSRSRKNILQSGTYWATGMREEFSMGLLGNTAGLMVDGCWIRQDKVEELTY